MVKVKIIKVDGCKVAVALVNGKEVDSVDIHSQFSAKEAKEFFKSKYKN